MSLWRIMYACKLFATISVCEKIYTFCQVRMCRRKMTIVEFIAWIRERQEVRKKNDQGEGSQEEVSYDSKMKVRESETKGRQR